MFTAILWDYDGTLANTPVKNLAVTRAVLARLDPALLDPLPEALTSLAAYQAANYRWRNWRELYRHALHVPADRLDEAGALWGPCQLADRTLPPLFDGLAEVLPDISYSAAHPELKMTLIFPQAARRLDDGRSYPTIVFVQGSGWTSPNIYYEIPQLSHFAQLGYIVATLTHRSALDGHRAPAFLEDVKTAIRFLREKAEEYKVDPHRIGIWGTSSGGNTALLAGLTGGDPAYRTGEYPEQSDHVRMVVDCFGPADAPKLLNGVLEQAKEQPLDGHDRKLFYGLLGETEGARQMME